MILDRLKERLNAWRDDGLYREMHCLESPMQSEIINQGKGFRVFSSGNYLGLANHPRQKAAMREAVENYGVGTGASHLVVGYTKQHQAAEEAFASACGFESAMLFSCGYMANVGIQQALLSRNDVVYQDRLNHASLLDGARLSGAKLKRFRHLNYVELEQMLRADGLKSKLVVSDTVFSMQGDEADLKILSQLRKKYGFFLIVDDAHGMGVVGQNGRGSLNKAGLSAKDIDLYVCPLGKAFGSFGAVVMGTVMVIDALRQFTRSYVYTTAMPAAMASAAKEALQIMQEESWRHKRLLELITYFKKSAKKNGIQLLPSDSAIQAFVVKGAEACCRVSKKLLQAGFLVTAIRQPTVPAGSEQLRFTLNVGQTENDIDALMAVIAEKPTLVLLPGLSFDDRIFQPFQALCESKFNVQAINYESITDQDCSLDEWFDCFIEKMPARAHYVGWSVGGLFAWKLAEKMPEKVISILSFASTPKFLEEENWPGVTKKDFAPFEQGSPEKMQRRLGQLCLQDAKLLKDFQLQQPYKSWSLGLRALKKWDMRAWIEKTSIPLLLVFSEKDALLPSRQLQKKFDKSRVLPQAEHACIYTHPGMCHALLLEFLSEY